MLGLIGLFALAALNAAVFLGARLLVGRRCGATSIRQRVGLDREWTETPLVRRVAFAAAGPCACYLLAVLPFAASLTLAGRPIVDESDMHVERVAPGSPAERAGFLHDDRIVEVDGVATDDWTQLRKQVHAHAGVPVRVVVKRDVDSVILTPVPDADGRLGVFERERSEPVSAARAFVESLGLPLWSEWDVVRHLIRAAGGGPTVTLSSARAVMAQNASGVPQERLALSILMLGVANATYLLWVSLLAAVVLFPRASKTPSSAAGS